MSSLWSVGVGKGVIERLLWVLRIHIDMTIYILDIYVFIFMSVLFYITYVNDVNA